MATYTLTSTGGSKSSGCAILMHTVYVSTLFQVGDLVYIVSDATNWGKLNRICIKKVYIWNESQSTYWIKANGIRYKDTFNGVWRESELTTYTNAVALVAQWQHNKDYTLSNLNPCPRHFRL